MSHLVWIKGGFCTRLPFIENLKNHGKTIAMYLLTTQETSDFEDLDKSKIAFRCVAEVSELDE